MANKPTYEELEQEVKALRKTVSSNAYIEKIYHSIAAPVMILDSKQNIMSVNLATERLAGVPANKLNGKKCYNVLHDAEATSPPQNCPFTEMLSSGSVEKTEMEVATLNGTFLISCDPVFDQNGSLERVIHISTDITEKNAVERKLRKSEEQYRRLVTNLQEGIWEIDKNAHTSFVNAPMTQMLGYTQDEMVGKHLFEFVDEKAVESAKRNLKKRQNGKKEQHEFEFLRKDGSKVYTLIETAPLFDDDGNYSGAVASVMDISRRKQAEEALRAEKSFAESLINTARTIILVLDTQGRIVQFNPYLEEITGYKFEEVKGKDWFSILLPERHRVRIRELFKNAMGDIQTRGNVNPIITKDGRRCVIEWYDKTLKDANDNVVGLIAVGQDITERKRTEEALLAEKDKLETVTRNIGVGLAIISKDYRTIWANEVIKDIFGEVEGKHCYLTYNQQSEICPDCGVHDIFTKGKSHVTHEQVGKDADGNVIWSQIIATPIKDQDGNVTSALEVVVPITARKLAEEAIKDLLKKYEKKGKK